MKLEKMVDGYEIANIVSGRRVLPHVQATGNWFSY